MRRLMWVVKAALCVLSAFAAGTANAASVTVTVEAVGKPLAGVVVSLQNPGGKPIPPAPGTVLKASIDQRNMRFVPHVLAVQTGTAVQFPNSDHIRHDVYSFSPAKTFELPLYKGTPAEPVLFDKAGIVVLGCNVHDWMLAFVDIVPTPYFAQTNAAGSATLGHVPAGQYALVVWGPRLSAPGHTLKQSLTLAADSRLTRRFKVTLDAEPAHVHRPVGEAAANVIRKLERKFDRFRHGPPDAKSSQGPSG